MNGIDPRKLREFERVASRWGGYACLAGALAIVGSILIGLVP